jgi:hypothetical protein
MVHVVSAMAIQAIGRQLQVRRIFGGVASLTGDPLMSACQRIFGLRHVVEAPARPTVRIVTRRTIRSETPLVAVLVAFLTGHRRVLKGRRLMTFLARHASMQPDQRESHKVMIEAGFLPPIDLVVALLAPGTEGVLVRIVLFVTRDAGRR